MYTITPDTNGYTKRKFSIQDVLNILCQYEAAHPGECVHSNNIDLKITFPNSLGDDLCEFLILKPDYSYNVVHDCILMYMDLSEIRLFENSQFVTEQVLSITFEI